MLQSLELVLPLGHDLKKYLNTCCTRPATPFLFMPIYSPKWGYFPSVSCGPIAAVPKHFTWTISAFSKAIVWKWGTDTVELVWQRQSKHRSVCLRCMSTASLFCVCPVPNVWKYSRNWSTVCEWVMEVCSWSMLPRLPEGVPWGPH